MADHGGAQSWAVVACDAAVCSDVESLAHVILLVFEFVLGDVCSSQAERASRVPFLAGWHLQAEAAAGGRVHRGECLFVLESLHGVKWQLQVQHQGIYYLRVIAMRKKCISFRRRLLPKNT